MTLTHLTELRGDGRWIVSAQGRILMETRSSVTVLRWLRKEGYRTPAMMGRKTTFTRDWSRPLHHKGQIG